MFQKKISKITKSLKERKFLRISSQRLKKIKIKKTKSNFRYFTK